MNLHPWDFRIPGRRRFGVGYKSGVNLRDARAFYLREVDRLGRARDDSRLGYWAAVAAFEAADADGDGPGRAAALLAVVVVANEHFDVELGWAEACINLAAAKSRFGQQGRAAAARNRCLPDLEEAQANVEGWQALAGRYVLTAPRTEPT
jgi:hypothetical protein